MSDVLVRGLSGSIHRQIQKMAEKENLSVNQMLLRLITDAARQAEERKEKEGREKEAFRRIHKMREEIYRRHGLLEDSTQLIREDRARDL